MEISGYDNLEMVCASSWGSRFRASCNSATPLVGSGSVRTTDLPTCRRMKREIVRGSVLSASGSHGFHRYLGHKRFNSMASAALRIWGVGDFRDLKGDDSVGRKLSWETGLSGGESASRATAWSGKSLFALQQALSSLALPGTLEGIPEF